MDRMNVIMVDGHPVTRTGQICVLNAAGIRVVGEFGKGEEALRFVEEARPDLVVLGLDLSGEMDGIKTLLNMKNVPNPPRILVHAAHNSADDLASCLMAGADGFLHKSCGRKEFLEAARSVASGKPVWFPGEREGKQRSGLHATHEGAPLTPMQREVLALKLRRYSNAEIAEILHISPQTVKNHVNAIFKKLPVKSRKELFHHDALTIK